MLKKQVFLIFFMGSHHLWGPIILESKTDYSFDTLSKKVCQHSFEWGPMDKFDERKCQELPST